MVELVGRVVLGGRSVRAARPSRGGLSRFDAEGARLVAVGLGGAPQADPGQLAGELERFVLGADAILPPLAAEVIDGDLVVGYAARGAETLDQTIARGATPPPRVADIADGVAQALGFLHDRGLAHGFLRPDLVSTDVGRIALEGYGLDRLILGCAGREALLSALGDPYAAPELAASSAREGRPAADVRALGVIIVELLAGRPVASDEAPREALAALGLAEP
ncbi:MAG: hypothetical protein KC776_39025, partial [Myxococcales bacterium]|nr:hypothetical protein [Myxococcales bacterium]